MVGPLCIGQPGFKEASTPLGRVARVVTPTQVVDGGYEWKGGSRHGPTRGMHDREADVTSGLGSHVLNSGPSQAVPGFIEDGTGQSGVHNGNQWDGADSRWP